MPTISVIVPVYKAEAYLHRCVESIRNQTFYDLEIILVDDGSPDNCGAICDEYAKIDSRIKVIHKENGGASTARNRGLEIATGEYIGFVDSDDYIHPQMYQLLYYYMKKDGSDIVSQQKVPSVHKEHFDAEADGKNRIVVSSQEVLEQFHEKYYILLWMAVPIKLYHRDVFRELRFREGIIYEDGDMFPEMVFNAHQITIIPLHLYYYTLSPDSVMRSGFSAKRLMVIGVWQRHVTFFYNRGLMDQCNHFAVVYLYSLLDLYQIVRKNYPELMPEMRKYICDFREMRPFMRKNCAFTRLQRLLLELFPGFLATRVYKVLEPNN